MASTVYVIDSSFKRTLVKVTPGKYLREVLEEVCRKNKLNPEEYTLKTQNNKALDLSQPFRLSGLSAGAKLNLTQASRSPGVVSVAIQLPENEGGLRQQDKFPSNTSLWLVLRKVEDAKAGASGKKLNLTQRGIAASGSGQGRLMYEQPCLNLLGRTLENFGDLQKTLAQLGLNGGSVLIRLSFKNSGQPLEEAMQEISQYFTSVGSSAAGAGASASQGPEAARTNGTVGDVPETHTDSAVTSAAGASTDPPDNSAMRDVHALQSPSSEQPHEGHLGSSSETRLSGDQDSPAPTSPPPLDPSNTINGIAVYRPPSSSTPAAALQSEDPSVFEPNIETAKAHQAALQRQGQNQRLRSDKELEEIEAARQQTLATVRQVTVRVRYPDQSMIETTSSASETSEQLYAKVRETLAHGKEPFELRYTGPKGTQIVLPTSPSQVLVRDFGFRGKVLVTLVWTDSTDMKARTGPSLKEEYRSRAQELRVELQSQQAASQAAPAPKQQAEPEKKGSGKLDVEAKMKKFLGFGKK